MTARIVTISKLTMAKGEKGSDNMSENAEKLLQSVEGLPKDKQDAATIAATAFLKGLEVGREMGKEIAQQTDPAA